MTQFATLAAAKKTAANKLWEEISITERQGRSYFMVLERQEV